MFNKSMIMKRMLLKNIDANFIVSNDSQNTKQKIRSTSYEFPPENVTNERILNQSKITFDISQKIEINSCIN